MTLFNLFQYKQPLYTAVTMTGSSPWSGTLTIPANSIFVGNISMTAPAGTYSWRIRAYRNSPFTVYGGAENVNYNSGNLDIGLSFEVTIPNLTSSDLAVTVYLINNSSASTPTVYACGLLLGRDGGKVISVGSDVSSTQISTSLAHNTLTTVSTYSIPAGSILVGRFHMALAASNGGYGGLHARVVTGSQLAGAGTSSGNNVGFVGGAPRTYGASTSYIIDNSAGASPLSVSYSVKQYSSTSSSLSLIGYRSQFLWGVG